VLHNHVSGVAPTYSCSFEDLQRDSHEGHPTKDALILAVLSTKASLEISVDYGAFNKSLHGDQN